MRRDASSWKADLRPFANAWYVNWNHDSGECDENAAVQEFRDIAARLTPEALADVEAATGRVTQTNCWFATWEAARLVKDVIRFAEVTS